MLRLLVCRDVTAMARDITAQPMEGLRIIRLRLPFWSGSNAGCYSCVGRRVESSDMLELLPYVATLLIWIGMWRSIPCKYLGSVYVYGSAVITGMV